MMVPVVFLVLPVTVLFALFPGSTGSASSCSSREGDEMHDDRRMPCVGCALYTRVVHGHGRDRGDVPGWVLVTIMTAGLVTALWLVADDKLKQMFSDALDGVSRQRSVSCGVRGRPMRRDGTTGARPIVEFTLVGILLTLLFLALLQLGLALHVRNTLVASAAEGARYGANADRDPAQGAALTRQLIRDSLADSLRRRRDVRAQRPSTASRRSTSGCGTTLPVIGLLGPPAGHHGARSRAARRAQ